VALVSLLMDFKVGDWGQTDKGIIGTVALVSGLMPI
jgi:hypothetical protein